MESLTIPEATARVNDMTLNHVSGQRMLREAQRGAIPTHVVGARLRVSDSDLSSIADYFARIDAARATAARLAQERAQRRALRHAG